ncbi:hypothetical protein SUGI_0426700 [Cryptomeria japonica]|uniref:shikimate O-hydroxycinnamoyltransferase isoform X2 n=1 Tax=Cryptomeria japonica TaxID=3369 RepID=UPI0024089400|nr:shikimate O-hydroxycinnamoyltransferase isoform X2 [Cryptomeria japonica]GLJ22653.1 hypothetical protein SUGI_0426700 [Cryptomeria japonica]
MDVTVTDSVLVKTVKSTPHYQLWVSNIDLVMVRFHSAVAYIYRRPPNGDSDHVAQILRDALSKVLVHFYPLAGRLIVDASGRIAVDCNGEGALFVEAVTESTIDDFGDFTSPSQVTTLVPSASYENGFTKSPLLMVQVTKFKCGGVALGTAIQHILSDGASSLHFVNSWCDVARGLQIHLLPQLDRSPLRARIPPSVSVSHQEFAPPPTLLHQEKDSDNLILHEEANKVSFGRFNLSKEQLNALRDEASENPVNKTYSMYIVLAAHIWKCCTIARGLQEKQRCKLYIPVDGRDRLCRPLLPRGYFGNAIFMATPIDIAGEIVSNPLWYTAEKIHESIAKMDDAYLRSELDFLELQPDLNAVIRTNDMFKCPNMSIISWTRLPFYEADFGWGRPTVVGPAGNPPDGLCRILPIQTTDGSVSIDLSLLKNHMVKFGKLLYEF